MEPEPSVPFANEAGDDRDDIKPGDQVLLIVENDLGFAKVLLDAARAARASRASSRSQRRGRARHDARVPARR